MVAVPGPRGGLTPRSDDLLQDLAGVVDALRLAWTGPLVLLGHSMGGLVAANFVAGSLGVVQALVPDRSMRWCCPRPPSTLA